MAAAQLAGRANEFMRRHRRLHSAAAHLSAPVRRTAVPVLFGNGRGLRVRTGPSTMMRLVSVVEADVEKTLLDLLGPGDVAYDIGANIGWFSLLAARKVGPSGGVIAFEPSLANVEFLRRNAASNRLDNLTILPTAVGDRDGWASFAEDSSLKGKLSEGGSQCVPLLSLDSWLAEVDLRPPQVVKIDVEGAEGAVLRGMAESLRSRKPTLIIELHGTNAEVADLLEAAGYEHHPIDHPAPTREAPWWVHVLAQG